MFVGGNGGTYNFLFTNSSRLFGRIFGNFICASSRFSVWTTFPRDKYWMVSRSTIFVCRIVTLLKFFTNPLIMMFSPDTYPKINHESHSESVCFYTSHEFLLILSPPLSSSILHLTEPDEIHAKPPRVGSISHRNGSASDGSSMFKSIGFIIMNIWWFLCIKPEFSRSAHLQ